jgi:hypothetical protein
MIPTVHLVITGNLTKFLFKVGTVPVPVYLKSHEKTFKNSWHFERVNI